MASTVQGVETDTAVIPTAVQLKRIAEAVDSNRSGDLLYVVLRVSGKAPFDVAIVTEDRAEAERVARENSTSTKRYVVFGPYQSVEDEVNRRVLNQFAVVVCHDPDSDQCDSRVTDRGFPPMSDVMDIEVVLRLRDGAELRVQCGDHEEGDRAPRPPDAYFVGLPAIDKFWIPYLHRIYGPDVARDKRRELLMKVREQGRGFRLDV